MPVNAPRKESYSAVITADAVDVTPATGVWTGLYSHRTATFEYHLTAATTEVADTLDVFIDTSLDGGTTWINIVHFAQSTGTSEPDRFVAVVAPEASVMTAPVDVAADAAAGAVRHFLGERVRVRYTMVQSATNDNESFTIAVRALVR